MKPGLVVCALQGALVWTSAALAQSPSGATVPVTADNFVRAEFDLYSGGLLKDSGAIGKFPRPKILSGK